MTIKLLHLYYDIMNMYGESGNMTCLVRALENQGVKIHVDFKSLEDKIDFNKYDLIYLGTCLDESYPLILEDLKKYKDKLTKYINDNKFIIATGNALDLFGDLEILKFKTKKIDFRIIGEQIYNCNLVNKKVIGFQNRDTVITSSEENSLFEVLKGTGYEPNILLEGICKNNFYGTYLLGPFLIRNPYFLEYIVKELMKQKNYKYQKLKENVAYTAYYEYLKNFDSNND